MSTFLWASGNVVVGQLGVGQDSGDGSEYEDTTSFASSSISTSISSSTTSSRNASSSSMSPTLDFNATGFEDNSQTVALGAGLGVGLGLPLLAISVGLLVLWMRGRRVKGVDQTGNARSGIHGQGQKPEFGFGVGSHKHDPARQMGRVQSPRELEGEPAGGNPGGGLINVGFPVRELQ
ncbi:uncharacterized protein BDV14DRAFT_204279 [Aspergillus stella-maris]|uniref:uncharacterized protein n=1 Tax=Aspergillus stella-maris TaxID=1810926 RepID=UPI003CCE29DA